MGYGVRSEQIGKGDAMVYSNPLSSYFTDISPKWWFVIGMIGITCGVIARKIYLAKKMNAFKAFSFFFLCEYMFIVLVSTVLSRKSSTEYLYKLELFWSYRNFFRIGAVGVLFENFYNTLLLLPYGLLCQVLCKRMTMIKILVSGSVISITIELLQLVFKRGYFELEDIFHNILGVLLGYMLYKLLCKLKDCFCIKVVKEK